MPGGMQAAAGPNRLAALTLTLGTHLLDLDRVPLSIAALTLSHAFVPPEALVALVTRHLAFRRAYAAFLCVAYKKCLHGWYGF